MAVTIFLCTLYRLQAKVVVAEQTERDIDEVRSKYIPVAVNTQILFFCVADMANIDPMYQYSLEWFIRIFLGGIANAERAGKCTNIYYSCALKAAVLNTKVNLSKVHLCISLKILLKSTSFQLRCKLCPSLLGED